MSTEKRTDAELLTLLEDCPEVGSRWRHYKTGNFYEVLEASQETIVLYRHSTIAFARPASEWEEIVEWNGELVLRFRRVEDVNL